MAGNVQGRPQRAARPRFMAETDDDSESSGDNPLANRPGTRSVVTSESRQRNSDPRISATSSSRQIKAPEPGKSTKAPASAAQKRKRTHKEVRRRPLGGRPVTIRTKTPASTSFSTGKLPPWPSGLPYGILLQIFQDAAYPLCDKQFQATKSVQWLLKTALVCKDFAEPALSALHYIPPLLPPVRAHRFLQHLESQCSSSFINYKSKVRYLELDGHNVLTRKCNGENPLDLKRLVSLTPQLKGLAIHLSKDIPQLNAVVAEYSKVSALYGPDLFEELDKCRIQLRRWKWNYHIMAGSDAPWLNLTAIHTAPSFKTIQHLEVTHLSDPIKRSATKWQAAGHELGEALALLPHLKSLKYVRSRLYSHSTVLANLPSLQALSIVDSEDLDSVLLTRILSSHGRKLKQLQLKYNRKLNLAFLEELISFCPVLEVLKVDLQCFTSSISTGGSTEPLFDVILPVGVIPTWPKTLQHIELLHLRKWDLSTPAPFFASLEQSAESLPYLRKLIIRSSIEFDWRDRIKFRDLWVVKLENVYLRMDDGPISILNTLKGKLATGAGQKTRRILTKPGSTRVLTTEVGSSNSDSDSDSDVPIMSKLKSQKIVDDSVIDLTVSASLKAKKSLKIPQSVHYQGLCELVDIRIENLRPMQTTFKEADFMDDEQSGDGDWNGSDVEESGRHAW